MILYTRLGWLVPVIWLAAVALASRVPEDVVAEHGLGLSRVGFVFLAAAALAAPALLLVGAALNRHKVPTTIRPLGRQREVLWGTHTFYQLPIGYWAAAVPLFTVVFYGIFTLV